MILKNFYNTQLSQASYLVGCPGCGEAVVIDPNRDVDQYIVAAEAEGLRIAYVTETHIHADYISGSRELAKRTGATLLLSDEGDADWKYAFASDPNTRLVRDGDSFKIGNLRFDVVATPGHTPEHISFVLTEEDALPLPICAFTGDFIFVGDVGRPDLLEKAAGVTGTMESGARSLFGSLTRFRDYPETMLLWPSHGAGSACGKSLGGVPTSALGREMATNWAFKTKDEQLFIDTVLSGQPEPPAYFKEMKRINKEGPESLGGFHIPTRVAGVYAVDAILRNALILDLRAAHESAAGTLPGAINIPLIRGFTTYAGSVLPFEDCIYLLAETEEQASAAKRMLGSIGFDRVAGWMGKDALRTFESMGHSLQTLGSTSVTDDLSGSLILDIRGAGELSSGRIPGSVHISLGSLPSRGKELPNDRPIVVHCAGGVRSPIGATVLQRMGFTNVSDLAGGYAAYKSVA